MQNVRLGASPYFACAGASLTGSVVVNSSDDPQFGGAGIFRADGVLARCEHSYVADNQILDPSDTAVIVFRTGNRRPQATQVLHNSALLAGNGSPAMLDADEFDHTGHGCAATYCDFTGTLIADNTLWSGPCVSTVFGLAVGTRSFTRTLIPAPPRDGRGAAFEDNGTGAGSLRAAVEAYVSGMYGAVVTGNFTRSDVRVDTDSICSTFNRRYPGARVFVGHGGGRIQRSVQLGGAGLDGCIHG
jgi:hypothetical protein